MHSDVFRRARIASEAFLDIKNWLEVLPRAATGETVTEIRLRNGSVITGSAENRLWPIFSDIWYHSSYTKHYAIPRNGLVVDVGANVGVFSVFASRVARQVYALEPAASNFRRLVSNVGHIPNIVTLNLACGARDGRSDLDVSLDAVSFSLKTQAPGNKCESVDTISLGTLFERNNVDWCDFLKLDCEGSEFDILFETEPAIFQRIGCIAMEYHDNLSKVFSHKDLLLRLRALGFTAKAYNPNGHLGMIAAFRDSA
jgi:FkbM family methyltransferase